MKTASMIFRQLFEPVSSTYTYLLGCEESGEAVLVDPVMPAWQRDLEAVNALGLKLVMTIDTHIHADHITSASMLRREAGSRIATPALDGLPCTDVAGPSSSRSASSSSVGPGHERRAGASAGAAPRSECQVASGSRGPVTVASRISSASLPGTPSHFAASGMAGMRLSITGHIGASSALIAMKGSCPAGTSASG